MDALAIGRRWSQKARATQSRASCRGIVTIPAKTLRCSIAGVAIVAVAISLSVLATSGSGGVIWRGDYETGNFDQWECGVQESADDRATIVTSPLRQGKYAARYEVRSGDHNVGTGDGERTEVKSCRHAAEGEEQWWAWSTMFAPGFSASNSDWNIFTQWHNSGTTGGRVEFYSTATRSGSPPTAATRPTRPPGAGTSATRRTGSGTTSSSTSSGRPRHAASSRSGSTADKVVR